MTAQAEKEIGMAEGKTAEGKRCITCGRDLPLTDFYRDRRNRDGRYSECKDCTKARRKAGREQARAAEARYRARHRPILRERQRAFYRAHREERIAAVNRSRAKRRIQEREPDLD